MKIKSFYAILSGDGSKKGYSLRITKTSESLAYMKIRLQQQLNKASSDEHIVLINCANNECIDSDWGYLEC